MDLNIIIKVPCLTVIDDGTPGGFLGVITQTFRLVDIINRIDDKGSYVLNDTTGQTEPRYPETCMIRCMYGGHIEHYRINMTFEELEDLINTTLQLKSMNL